MNGWLAYFRRPFPSGEGFSAYRFPGLIVHLPVIVAFVFLGFALLAATPKLLPLLGVYLVIGLYVGRDVAIFCHHVPIALIAVFIPFIAAAIFPEVLVAGLRNIQIQIRAAGFGFSLVVTAVVAALFIYYVHRRVRTSG